MSKSVSEQMAVILDDYSTEVKDIARKNAKKAARDTAKELRIVSPKKTGDYAVGWTSKKLDADTFVTYNRKMPGLTHLLEYGHLVKPTPTHPGKKKRVQGIQHIKPVETEQVEEFEANIIRDLQKR